jgi:hypothetical protein
VSHFRSLSTAIVCLAAACGPNIKEFTVTPRHICVGDTVHISFNARGAPYLTTVSRDSAAVRTTRYRLVAEARGKRAFREVDVTVFSDSAAPTLAFDTDTLGTDSLRALGTLPADSWPDLLRIETISVDSSRSVRVIHRGRSGVLLPGETGSTWAGTPVSGEWEVHAPILPGEEIGSTARHPPTHLQLRVAVRCNPGGPSR